MNKFLIFSLILGFSFVFLLLASPNTVLAEDQGANATVQADLNLSASPDPMLFGSLSPGASNTITTTLTPGTSDLSVTIGINNIGTLFEDNLMIDIAQNGTFVDPENSTVLVAAGTPKLVDYRLNVPIGTQSGDYSATITYTVSENI